MTPDLPFAVETDLERRLAADPRWRRGVEWGFPRRGHPEGKVKLHVAEVLANLDRLGLAPAERARLRIAALAHDSFKREVRWWRPKAPPNEHGFIAARWLAGFIDDGRLLALVELHDEGFRAWRDHRDGQADRAARRVDAVVARLGDEVRLFVAFYWADNRSGDKDPAQVGWFVERLVERGVSIPVPAPAGGDGR